MHAEYKDNKIVIYDSYIHKETIKQIAGRIWEADKKAWIIPFCKDNITLLKMIGCQLDEELLKKLKEIQQRITRDIVISAIEPMPIKAIPYSHQIEAYNKACNTMGIFRGGDEIVKRSS